MDATSFGQWLKQRRKALGLTQEELAQQVSCAAITIKKIEADQRRPSRQIAERLADQLLIAAEERTFFLHLARAAESPVAVTATARAAPASPSATLPVPLTALIGRERELAEVLAYLLRPAVRLLTLVGPPGVGKTRLALEVARSLDPLFRDGVCFVSLAAINDPELLPSAIMSALDLAETPGATFLAQIQQRLRDRELLLVLDNFEHLLGAALTVTVLLATAPGLKVLISSREMLHVYGEHLFEVLPLLLPAPESRRSLATLAQCPSVALFTARAQATQYDFALTSANAELISTLCTQLDGLPLALELAAARSVRYGLQTVLDQISSQLHVLADGPRDWPARQQSLHATLDWSYALLSPVEQQVLRRISVCVDGCVREAAAALCADDGRSGPSVDDTLASLADKSLVYRAPQSPTDGRVLLLETIRSYGLEQLAASGDEPIVRRRHAEYYLSIAEAAAAQRSDQRRDALASLEREQPNIRVALQWSLDQNEAMALRFAAALWPFWRGHTHLHEGRRWLTAVLGRTSGCDSVVRGMVLYGAGWLAYDQSDIASAQVLFEEALLIFRAQGTARAIGLVLHGLGELAYVRGQYQGAAPIFEESLALFRQLDDTEEIAWSLDHLGRGAMYQGDYRHAAGLFEESVALFGSIQHQVGRAYALVNLGCAALSLGDLDDAQRFLEQALAQQQAVGDQKGVAITYVYLGKVAFYHGQLALAERLFRQSLYLSREAGYIWCSLLSLDGLGRLATRRGVYARAAVHFREALSFDQALHEHLGRLVSIVEGIAGLAEAEADPALAVVLWSATDALRRARHMPMSLPEHADYQRQAEAVRQLLSTDQWAASWTKGSELSIDQLIVIALRALGEN